MSMAAARAPAERGRPVERGGDGAVDAEGVGEDERAVAADAPGVAAGAVVHVLAHGRRPKIRVSTARKVASPASSTSVRRSSREPSNRMVGCGSQARRAPAAERQLHADLRRLAVARAIDLLGRGGGDGRLGAGAQRHLEVHAVAAGEPARRVEQHGLGRRALGRAWESARARRRPGAGRRDAVAPSRRANSEPDRAFRPWQPGPRLQHRRRPLRARNRQTVR